VKTWLDRVRARRLRKRYATASPAHELATAQHEEGTVGNATANHCRQCTSLAVPRSTLPMGDMRILVVLRGYPSGDKMALLTLVQRWREIGLKVRILRPADGAFKCGNEGSAELCAHCGTSQWRQGLRLFKGLPAEIRRWQPDVIFCPDPMYAAVAIIARTVLGRLCPPIVASINHVLDLRHRPRFSSPERSHHRSKLSEEHACNTTWSDKLLARLADRLSLVHLLSAPAPSFVDATETMRCTHPRRIPSSHTSYVLLGNSNDPKSFVQGVRAFALAGRLGDRLTIIGYGGLRARLEKWGRALHVDNVIDFAPPSRDPLEELEKHDVLMLPSRDPGVPNAMVHALAAGLGVIGSDTDAGVRALLDDGALGALAVWGDVVSLSHAMLSVPMPSRERVHEKLVRCSLEKSAQTFVDQFRSVTSLQSAPAPEARHRDQAATSG
jgi:glycosyltransferase involved in cell wall biosynthesis